MAFGAVLAAAFPAAILLTLQNRSRRTAALVAAAVALACVLAQGLRGFGRYSLAGSYAADRVLAEAMAEPPPRALLVSNYFQTVFGLWYVQAIEGARPDVAIHHPRFAANAPPADAARRPALYELGPDAPRTLSPVGLLYRQGRADGSAFVAQDALWDRLAAEADDELTREYLLWQVYLGAELRCHLGLRPAAQGALDRATLLGGGDTPEVAALRAQCPP
jgi:hypothetical protein